jgi:hypothetical protein
MVNVPPPTSPHGKSDRQKLQDAAAGAGLILPDMAVQAFQQGRVIEAIKLIRTANPGLDLTRAKAVVERMQAQAHSAAADMRPGSTGAGKASMPLQSHRPPTVAKGDPPGQVRWLLVVVAIVAVATWLAFSGGF